jgi:uncharacterized membrane protein (UPF0182 family)
VRAQTVPRPFPIIGWLQRRPRWQWVVAGALVALYLLFQLVQFIAALILDRWWYDSVTDSSVWSTIVGAKVLLAVVAGAVTALVLGGSIVLTFRHEPVERTELGALTRRYRDRMGPAHRWLLIGVVAFLTIRIGAAAIGQWQSWLLFRHGPHVGQRVPEVGGDLGYYLFDLPFLVTLSSWIRQLLLLTLILTAFCYAVSGALRLPIGGRRSSRPALAHLGLIAALLATAQALDYVFVRRPALTTSSSGSFVGAGYTELHVLVPAAWVLGIVALVTAFLLVDGARRGKWRPALVALSVWLVLQLVLGVAAPLVVQRYVVAPAEAARELPYLTHNLEATRDAFRLDAIDQAEAPLADGLGGDATAAAALTGDLSRVPLFDVAQLPDALQVLAGTTATRITDVDLDRYRIEGENRPVFLAPRNASRGDLPEQGWVQLHLVYTHGDGVVTAPANLPDADGRPDVDALATTLAPERPELYFGENLAGWYAIVGTKRVEQGGAQFDADTGIPLSSLWQRAVLSLSSGEIEPLFSAELTSDSQLLYRRDVVERLQALAPFLTFGNDPYPVILDDRVVWVLDGYTTSSSYPYAQYVGLGGVPVSGSSTVNYLHGSVKATVDAYDGTVHLYRTAEAGADDPVLDAWDKIFPGLVEPISAMPAELAEHQRYPEALLQAQSALLGKYHVSDAETLFNGTARWSPSAAASTSVGKPGTGSAPAVSLFQPGVDPVLGGHWVATLPFSPGTSPTSSTARDELAAMAIADHDDYEVMRLFDVETEPGEAIATPSVAQSAIDADPELSRQFALLNANGSTVQFGPMTPVLADDALVWVRSIIVTATANRTVPRLYGVVAVSDGLVGLGDTAPEALDAAVAQATGA